MYNNKNINDDEIKYYSARQLVGWTHSKILIQHTSIYNLFTNSMNQINSWVMMCTQETRHEPTHVMLVISRWASLIRLWKTERLLNQSFVDMNDLRTFTLILTCGLKKLVSIPLLVESNFRCTGKIKHIELFVLNQPGFYSIFWFIEMVKLFGIYSLHFCFCFLRYVI